MHFVFVTGTLKWLFVYKFVIKSNWTIFDNHIVDVGYDVFDGCVARFGSDGHVKR